MTKYDIVEFEPGWYRAELDGESFGDTIAQTPERTKDKLANCLKAVGFTKRYVETVECE